MPYNEYLYPNLDILTIGFTGVPNNTNKYTNADEGVSTATDSDIVTKSGLAAEINGRHSLQFGLTSSHVIPSGSNLNIRVNASSSNILATGNLWLERALLLDSNSGLIASYEYKSAGEPTYSWGLNSAFSNQTVVLSGFGGSSPYFKNPICDIRLSGDFSAISPLEDNFKLSISAFEFNNSGVIGVEYSGIPLFISGPRPVVECLTVIDASGLPVNTNCPSGVWFNETWNVVENNPTWWTSVNDGVHNPDDSTYIIPLDISAIHPVGISGGGTTGIWTDENGGVVTSYTLSDGTIKSVNSGVYTPVDGSYWKTNPGSNNYTFTGPEPLFNREGSFNEIAIGMRGYKVDTGDTVKIHNMVLKNGNGTTLANWGESFIFTNTTANYTTQNASVLSTDLTPINNYITFDVFHSGGAAPPIISGHLRLTEIDLLPRSTDVNSPYFYFNDLTLNNTTSGNVCFRLRIAQENTYNSPFTISNIIWKNVNNSEITHFDDISILPSSNFYNYCTPPSAISIDSVTNRSYLSFKLDFTTTSGYNYDDIFISELEICVTGLDPIQSSYIPLYIGGLTSVSSGLDLYVQGYDTKSSGIDLYINGYESVNSGIPLYIGGYDTQSSGMTLYTAGHLTTSSGIPLFINGPIPVNSSISLYTQGPIPNSSFMPLFLKADPIPTSNSNLPLSIWGTSHSGLFGTAPLTITGTGTLQTSMILFLKNDEVYHHSSYMPLFLKTIGNLDGSLTLESGIPLFLGNYWTSINSGLNLYVSVTSGTDGAIPITSTMPLFIARDSEGTANNLPLYLRVADQMSGILPLYTQGAFIPTSSIPLVISSTYAMNSSNLTLFSHGH